MLKSMFIGAFKSPGKFLALCLALYIATQSIVVAVFVVVAAISHFKGAAKKEPRSHERDSTEGHEVDTAQQQPKRGQAAPARSDVHVAPTPQRQYAKSAVVIPMKARSSSTGAHSLKLGAK
ncbi:hypothetical protein VI03_08715 [Burkholderia vietnamiensis]|uniref:hypothetical protein n=1 Tax=Burkholderia vietnamiensis TaxID=60552 RepID=UPI0006229F39|nr:hypothetical protein [Burkholderia vietnamiensis]KKI39309.1 hypothetical protein VI03_08715 [Burkholderia vietnamiensis]